MVCIWIISPMLSSHGARAYNWQHREITHNLDSCFYCDQLSLSYTISLPTTAIIIDNAHCIAVPCFIQSHSLYISCCFPLSLWYCCYVQISCSLNQSGAKLCSVVSIPSSASLDAWVKSRDCLLGASIPFDSWCHFLYLVLLFIVQLQCLSM